MANALYPLWKQEILKGTSNNLLNLALLIQICPLLECTMCVYMSLNPLVNYEV